MTVLVGVAVGATVKVSVGVGVKGFVAEATGTAGWVVAGIAGIVAFTVITTPLALGTGEGGTGVAVSLGSGITATSVCEGGIRVGVAVGVDVAFGCPVSTPPSPTPIMVKTIKIATMASSGKVRRTADELPGGLDT
jgi:hypothetical protein